MRLTGKRLVSVGIIGSFLFTGVPPSFALREPQKETKQQRAGLEDALQAKAGNFRGGVASRAATGLEEAFERVKERVSWEFRPEETQGRRELHLNILPNHQELGIKAGKPAVVPAKGGDIFILQTSATGVDFDAKRSDFFLVQLLSSRDGMVVLDRRRGEFDITQFQSHPGGLAVPDRLQVKDSREGQQGRELSKLVFPLGPQGYNGMSIVWDWENGKLEVSNPPYGRLLVYHFEPAAGLEERVSRLMETAADFLDGLATETLSVGNEDRSFQEIVETGFRQYKGSPLPAWLTDREVYYFLGQWESIERLTPDQRRRLPWMGLVSRVLGQASAEGKSLKEEGLLPEVKAVMSSQRRFPSDFPLTEEALLELLTRVRSAARLSTTAGLEERVLRLPENVVKAINAPVHLTAREGIELLKMLIPSEGGTASILVVIDLWSQGNYVERPVTIRREGDGFLYLISRFRGSPGHPEEWERVFDHWSNFFLITETGEIAFYNVSSLGEWRSKSNLKVQEALAKVKGIRTVTFGGLNLPLSPEPRKTGLEETNIRRAARAGSIICFDFFENISGALIDAAIAAGATEFTMNPYSTGNYIRHLLTLSASEGKAKAEELLGVGTDEEWSRFKQGLAQVSAPVGRAILAAMEPSPDVTPQTELALAKVVTQSMLDEAQVVMGMLDGFARDGKSGEEAYWIISKEHFARKIAGRLLPIFQQSQGQTGYVSIEVDPRIEREEFAAQRAIPAYRSPEDWMRDRMQTETADLRDIGPNILVKVPATKAGIATIRLVNANYNTTLAFADDDAKEAIAAHEARKDPAHRVRVSPFVSRNAVYFQEFWGDLLREADGHVCTICNTYAMYKALGPYADGSIWSSLGMKVKGDPGELYAKQVVGVGILNMPPETARDFNGASFVVERKFGVKSLEEIVTGYFQEVQEGKIPSAVKKFPALMEGKVTPQDQARRAVAEWRRIQDSVLDSARLDQVEKRIGELEAKSGKPRSFTREGLAKARARVQAGERVTEKELMRLILKAEGEEKFIIPFQGAVDALQRAIDQTRVGLEEERKSQEPVAGKLEDKAVFVVIPPSPFGPALLRLGTDVYTVAFSLQEALEQGRQGMPSERLIGVVDYLLTTPESYRDSESGVVTVGSFMTLTRGSDVDDDWWNGELREAILNDVKERISRGRRIVVVDSTIDKAELAAILKGFDVDQADIDEVIQAGLEETEYLGQMR